MARLITLLVVAALTVTVAAQGPPVSPDFAGRWRLVTPAPSAVIAEELLIRRASFGQAIVIERRYRDGAREEVFSTDPTSSQHGSLVLFERGSGGAGGAPATADYLEEWSFDAAGRLVIAATERFPRARPLTTRLIYERMPAPELRFGENLLENATGDRAGAGWKAIENARVEPCEGDPCFVVRHGGRFVQTIVLPPDAAGKFIVMIGSGASERTSETAVIAGLPSLDGLVTLEGNPRSLTYFQDQAMLARPQSAHQWVTMSGVFAVPAGATHVGFQLSRAEGHRDPQSGSAARFDDVGAYMFRSEVEARRFVSEWRGRRRSPVTSAPTPPSVAPRWIVSVDGFSPPRTHGEF